MAIKGKLPISFLALERPLHMSSRATLTSLDTEPQGKLKNSEEKLVELQKAGQAYAEP